MDINYILLILATSIKSGVLFFLSYLLFERWQKQERKYYTDFPFLMSLTFGLFALGKLFDIWLYSQYYNVNRLQNEYLDSALLIAKLRFIFIPFYLSPLVILLLILWFGGKRKEQIFFTSFWLLSSIFVIILSNSYESLLLSLTVIAIPPLILNSLTFFIIWHQKKQPQLDSLRIAVGWLLYIISQIIRPFWSQLGDGQFGFSWVGELFELLFLILIGNGFFMNYIKDTTKSIKNN